jgi:simple sugar transport system ATP-binding protein
MVNVPEERLGRGTVPPMTLSENAVLTAHRLGMLQSGLVKSGVAATFTDACIAGFDVRCSGPAAKAQSLSGGNLQKFIVGREIRQMPRVMVVAQPTWGVDVAASALIRQQIIDLAVSGVGVLVISEDLGEILEMCDRVMVIAAGRMSPSRNVSDTGAEEIGRWMAGIFPTASSPMGEPHDARVPA